MGRPGQVARFKPLRRASRGRLRLLYTIGPVLWVLGIGLTAFVIHHADSVVIALIVLGASVLFSLVTLLPMRARRIRLERKR